MPNAVPMVEIWRGGLLESQHIGHAVICDSGGEIVEAWGDPERVLFPRSSCKMLQALPLLESGAANAFGLKSEHLALACASHDGALIHTDPVEQWLANIGKGESDLRCGTHQPTNSADRFRLHDAGLQPCQVHNNCSGKHTGFLTLASHLRAGPEYIEPSHPVQAAVKQAFEEMTGENSPGHGIDGCSAPNFATSLAGLARAMARMARPAGLGAVRAAAAVALVQAMIAHPQLVAGVGKIDSELMSVMDGVAIKGGADGVYVAILPKQGYGVALKIDDGAERAKNAAIAALLVHLGALEASHPVTRQWVNTVARNWRGFETGHVRTSPSFIQVA